MSQLKQAIDDAGGVPTVAAACGISPRAVYKWVASGCLPRTEYTGETDYAVRVASLAAARGVKVDVAELRSSSSPKRSAAWPVTTDCQQPSPGSTERIQRIYECKSS